MSDSNNNEHEIGHEDAFCDKHYNEGLVSELTEGDSFLKGFILLWVVIILIGFCVWA